jgi:hypothetical protein
MQAMRRQDGPPRNQMNSSSEVQNFTEEDQYDTKKHSSKKQESRPLINLKAPLPANGELLDKNTAENVLGIMFGSHTRAFNEEWQQGFFFNEPGRDILQYGLVQRKVLL